MSGWPLARWGYPSNNDLWLSRWLWPSAKRGQRVKHTHSFLSHPPAADWEPTADPMSRIPTFVNDGVIVGQVGDGSHLSRPSSASAHSTGVVVGPGDAKKWLKDRMGMFCCKRNGLMLHTKAGVGVRILALQWSSLGGGAVRVWELGFLSRAPFL